MSEQHISEAVAAVEDIDIKNSQLSWRPHHRLPPLRQRPPRHRCAARVAPRVPRGGEAVGTLGEMAHRWAPRLSPNVSADAAPAMPLPPHAAAAGVRGWRPPPQTMRKPQPAWACVARLCGCSASPVVCRVLDVRPSVMGRRCQAEFWKRLRGVEPENVLHAR